MDTLKVGPRLISASKLFLSLSGGPGTSLWCVWVVVFALI